MQQWDDSKPIYLQLRDTVVHRILVGSLSEGEPIPSVRQVAAEEKVNPITVSKAYQLLVDVGLVEKKRGLGMFVTEGAQELALQQERTQFMEEEWPAIVARLAALGLNLEDLPAPQIAGESA
ncbi:MAG: GntR family transcriptional regulator [Pseudomonadota bacterium]